MLQETREEIVSKPSVLRHVHAEQCDIFSAISLSDPSGAEAAMNLHLNSFVRRWSASSARRLVPSVVNTMAYRRPS